MNVTALTWPCHDLPVAWRVPAAELPFPLLAAPAIGPDAILLGYGVEGGFVVLDQEPGQRQRPEPERTLREKIERDETPFKYAAPCDRCGTEMGVNLYGMGTCPSCGFKRNPMQS